MPPSPGTGGRTLEGAELVAYFMWFKNVLEYLWGFSGGSVVKNPPANAGDKQIWSLNQEDPLEEEMATHFSILAWKIPWTEETGRLQSMGFTKSQTWQSDWAQGANKMLGVLLKCDHDRVQIKC